MSTSLLLLFGPEWAIHDFFFRGGGGSEKGGSENFQNKIPAHTYSLRHKKCGVRGFIHELFVSKTRTSAVRASEGF